MQFRGRQFSFFEMICSQFTPVSRDTAIQSLSDSGEIEAFVLNMKIVIPEAFCMHCPNLDNWGNKLK